MNPLDPVISPSLFDLPVHHVVSGTLYHDGWCTPYLCVQFPELRGRVRVDVEFWNPAMIDLDPNDVVVRADHRAIASFRNLLPEQIRSVQQDVDVQDGRGFFLSIRSAGRCPQSADDLRSLSLVIRQLSVEIIQEEN
jgi:hypothetical protein